MDDYRIGTLVNELLRTTREGKATWKRTDSLTGFLYKAANGSFVVESEDSFGAGGANFKLSIYNSEGTLIETIGSGAGADMFSFAWSSQLQELYQLARNSALQVDTTLDALLRELEDQ